MRILKKEMPDLAKFQTNWLARVHPERNTSWKAGDAGYEYDFIPGIPAQDPAAVIEFLSCNVWNRPAFADVEPDPNGYLQYVIRQAQKAAVRGFEPSLLDLGVTHTPVCLVHGDATLENFLYTESGIVAIDPGLSRGFSTRNNDRGKLLQSCLTQWNLVKYGQPTHTPLALFDYPLSVDYFTVSSLITHWIRIIKNEHRHAPRVGRFGREVVIPTLQASLASNQGTRLSGSRWDTGFIKTIYDLFLSAGHAFALP